MISLEPKTQTSTSSSPLNTAPPTEDTPSLSFSQLLKGISEAKDTKVIQNGALLLSLDGDVKETKIVKESKLDTLISLLKGNEITKEDIEPLSLTPNEIVKMTPIELKTLISDAKNYLKEKIVSLEGFKKAEIQALPKTLKGLVQVAQKLGIDISKVSIDEVTSSSKTQLSVEIDEKVLSLKDEKTLKIDEKNPKDVKLSTKTQETPQEIDLARVDTKIKELPKEIKAMPLFKAQTSSELTTEQLVSAKLTTNTQVQTPKQKADTTLQMLLRGTKTSKSESGLTADFSVSTARVIAPSASTEVSKNLESLLRGDASETTSKVDGLNVSKADSFEVKLNEAKQMIKYLSNDVKTAIEDYKSPFTRIKVQLNPQRLGEVDLTIVQRGKNLHINLSSNNAAINALSLNANELKTQLNNSGINNASLNFNNNSQSSDGNTPQQQQQNRQNEQNAKEEYTHFDLEGTNEELTSSLEIVVPHYA